MLTNGVLPNPSTNLQVQTGTGMNVIVNPGFAVIEGGLKYEETQRTLAVQAADTTYDRIDTVVLRWNDNANARSCDLYVIQGTPASKPVRPELNRESSVYEIGLADLFIAANSSAISSARIADTRYESARCGIISSIAEFNSDTIYEQIQADLAGFKAVEQAQFLAWFGAIKDQLSEDAAGNLQLQINETNRAVKNNAEFLEKLKAVPVNNNILINSNFANPVNQRGYDGTITDKSMYTIDRWKLNAGQSFNIDSNGITFKSGSTNTYFVQKIAAKDLFGKIVSLSMKINGEIYSINNVLVNKDERVVDLSISNGSILMFIGYDSTDRYSIGVILYNGATPTIEWAKLEYGEVATPYVPRLYDEELRLCQIYYTKFAGSRAFNVWGINSASIRFAGFLPHIMRIPPTVVINAIGISINGATTTIDDFEFNVSSISKSYVYIDAIKGNHGLTFNNCLSLVADFILDAEL